MRYSLAAYQSYDKSTPSFGSAKGKPYTNNQDLPLIDVQWNTTLLGESSAIRTLAIKRIFGSDCEQGEYCIRENSTYRRSSVFGMIRTANSIGVVVNTLCY